MGTASKPTTDDHKKALHETLEDAGTVMMMTRGSDGALHGRPMAVQRVDSANQLYFSTSASSGKIADLERDPRVDVVFQSKTRYATIAGHATVSRDRKLIDELWNESWKIYFPKGKDDPDIALVIVDPERGEYWDLSGVKGFAHLFRAARAYLTGTELRNQEADAAGMHGEVKL